VFNIPLALVVMQVLAVDLGTDLVPALALGTEKPEPGLMDRPPRGPKDRIVDRKLIVRAFLWLGSLQTALCFAGFFFLWWTMGYRDLFHLPRPDLLPYAQRLLTHEGLTYVLATSMFHAGVVTTQIGNAYACRTERTSVFKAGFFANRFLLFGFAFELALIALMIYTPPFQVLFEEGPLPLGYWGFLFLYPPIMFFAEEGRKAILRRMERRRLGKKLSTEARLA
jgi:magnesium-transporting ATPase (P-type)